MGNTKIYHIQPQRFPVTHHILYNTMEADVWLLFFSKCPHPNIHALRIQWHNKSTLEFCKQFISYTLSKFFTSMNVGTYNNNHCENIVLK